MAIVAATEDTVLTIFVSSCCGSDAFVDVLCAVGSWVAQVVVMLLAGKLSRAGAVSAARKVTESRAWILAGGEVKSRELFAYRDSFLLSRSPDVLRLAENPHPPGPGLPPVKKTLFDAI